MYTTEYVQTEMDYRVEQIRRIFPTRRKRHTRREQRARRAA
jgi:hypothetical protein